MAAVFKGSRSRGSARLVLLALADVAADTGEVTAYKRSQSIIAAKANIDPKTVPKAVDALLELAELVVIDTDGNEQTTRAGGGHGRRSTNYRVRLEVLDPAVYGVRGSGGQTPPDTGSDPAGAPPLTPPDAGSIIPSGSVPDPSPSVSPSGRGKKTLLPDGFTVDLEMRAWADNEGVTIDVDRETEKFRDYWVSKGERRVDWTATWRNWIRRAQDDAATRRGGGRGRPAPPLPARRNQDAPAGRVEL